MPTFKDRDGRFQTIFEFAPDAYYLSDFRGTFVDGNQAAERTIGYSRHELIGKNFLSLHLLSAWELPRAAELLARNAIGQPTGPDEFVLNRKDGSQVPVEIRTQPVTIDGRQLVLGIARDISERKQAEEAIRQSEAKYRNLVETTGTGYTVFDEAGRVLDANAEYVRLSGHQSLEEIQGRNALDWTAEHDRERTGREIAMCLQNRCTKYLQIDYAGPNGRATPIEIHVNAVDTPAGRRILALCTDITDRKRNEMEVQKEYGELERRVAERTSELQKANTQLKAEIAEREKAQLAIEAIVRGTVSEIGQDFFASFAAEVARSFNVAYVLVCQHLDSPLTRVRTLAFWSRDRLAENVVYELAGGPCAVTAVGEMTFYPHEIQQLFPADNDLVELGAESYCGFPLHDRTGKIIGHLAMLDTRPMETNLCDISVLQIFVGRAAAELERELAGEALQRNEAQLRLITDAMPAFISYLGADRRYQFVNKHYEDMFGVKQEEIVGRHVWDILGADAYQAIRPRIDSALSGNRESYEASVELNGLGKRMFSTEYIPDIGPDGTVRGYCTLAVDITDRIEAEEMSRRHRDELAHVGRLSTMGEMATGLAHELNQPLMAISLYAGTCLTKLKAASPEDPANIASILEDLGQQAVRAGAIVNRIRKLVKKETVSEGPVQIENILNDVLSLLAAELNENLISVAVQLPESLPELYGDAVQIEQVLLNLVRNAIEAINEGGNGQRQIVVAASNLEGGCVEITVHDTGPGLTQEAKTRVFDPFFSTKSQGMGMGLAICRTIVEAHGGHISITSNSEHGATCHVRLPTHGKRNGSQS